jgi:hypothetical protein
VETSVIQDRQGGDRASASIRIRVRSERLEETADALANLGIETYRSIEVVDVTGDWVDLEARLKNHIALRNRLKDLLAEASGVEEILKIETELARVQGEIDAMTARFNAMKGQVSLASLSLNLQERSIPGPAGIATRGIGWTIKKLFVLK